MNIEGLGPAIVGQLLESNLVESPADLYELTISDCGFGPNARSRLII